MRARHSRYVSWLYSCSRNSSFTNLTHTFSLFHSILQNMMICTAKISLRNELAINIFGFFFAWQNMNFLAIWLAFNLAIPSIVFLIIISWELMKDDDRMYPLNIQKTSKQKCKIAMKIILPTFSGIFVFTYISLALYLQLN